MSEIKFVTGFAGSGKSTELAARATSTTLVMTPTHKAAEVLMKKGIIAYTIHSILKLVPTINQNFRKGQKIQSLKMVGDTDLEFITDIFIDEFSMINKEILDLLLEVIPESCEVTIFGDPYQLPPVSGKRIKPKKYSSDIHELTTQHRSEAPEVVDCFMSFVTYLKGGCKGKVPKINLPKGNLLNFDPLTERALAYTNDRVSTINHEIFKQGKFAGDIIINNLDCKLEEVNDGPVIFPKMLSKGRLIYDKDIADGIIESIEKFNTDLSNYKIITVKINNDYYGIYSDKNHYENSKIFRKNVEKFQHLVVTENNLDRDVDLTKWCRANRNAKYVRERGQAWSKYMAHKDLVFDVRFSFTTTVHKSQGQEFKKVYVDVKDISKCQDKEMYARLCYVGLSRAIKEAVVI
mgnify:CR=1 FL=1